MPERHEVIARFTRDTYGILLYQDQVIEILRELGMGADDLTTFLKAVKASNADIGGAAVVIAHYEALVAQMCVSAGMCDKDVSWLWEALQAFSAYGFNRAHATIYGITAYRCAYLATHHPVEFHAALLAVAAGTDKEQKYISTTVKRGVKLLKPDVNYSQTTYAVDPNGRGVRKGLVSIKGIGYKAARAITGSQPFKDMADFAERVNPRMISGLNDYRKDGTLETGRLEILNEAGALRSLT
jgi:DNA polymerase-3 subunit alpha